MGKCDEIWEFSDESELLCPKNDRSTFIDYDSHDDAVAATKWDDPLKWQPGLGCPSLTQLQKVLLTSIQRKKKQLSCFTIGTCNP